MPDKKEIVMPDKTKIEIKFEVDKPTLTTYPPKAEDKENK